MNAGKIARTHPSAQTQRSEGDCKLMWNASAEEQRALKPVAKCVKNHSGFTTWRATCVLCSEWKHWRAHRLHGGIVKYSVILTLFLVLLPFQSLFLHTETNQAKHVRKSAVSEMFDILPRVCEQHSEPDVPYFRAASSSSYCSIKALGSKDVKGATALPDWYQRACKSRHVELHEQNWCHN